MTATSQHRTPLQKKERITTEYNHDTQEITWFDYILQFDGKEYVWEKVKSRFYMKGMVTYVIGMLCYWTKDELFSLVVNSQKFLVSITYDGYGHYATTDNYDGPEDKINSNFDATRESALEGLIEKLQMAIEEGRI